jgi:hypothetical protein
VIGAHGYGVIDRVLGTTAVKVVNHLDRSVFVVRAPDRLPWHVTQGLPPPGRATQGLRVGPRAGLAWLVLHGRV